MATTPTAPVTPHIASGVLIDTILHDVLIAGTLAASIFVKNPAHQQTAGAMINAVNVLLKFLDPQLTGTTPTPGT
jgi:hypothetical protein